jgi:hypothetical protein
MRSKLSQMLKKKNSSQGAVENLQSLMNLKKRKEAAVDLFISIETF